MMASGVDDVAFFKSLKKFQKLGQNFQETLVASKKQNFSPNLFSSVEQQIVLNDVPSALNCDSVDFIPMNDLFEKNSSEDGFNLKGGIEHDL